MKRSLLCLLFVLTTLSAPLVGQVHRKVLVGVDILLSTEYSSLLKGKKIGLVTNHTAVNAHMHTTADLLKIHAKDYNYTLVALFAPEHGLTGAARASEHVYHAEDVDGIPVYSLHGPTRRPTEGMLKGIDLMVFDIQDIGSRSYTYTTTLFYVMEEAAKRHIPVIVLDRPNPINGLTIDGPMLEDEWRSFVGYVNVPYCHGMTVGELARYFNAENKVGCNLTVVPMKGWKRWMQFQDTGLTWIPTSPHVPEASTAFYYPTTGILGELGLVNIGVGYTLPFKLVGAPWINAKRFAKHLNAQNFPGVSFTPFHYRPFYGKYANSDCEGVMIVITDPDNYLPVSTQYLLIGILKSLYPKQFDQAMVEAQPRKEIFCKVNGTCEIYDLMAKEKYVVWKLREIHQKERQQFATLRKKYLIPSY